MMAARGEDEEQITAASPECESKQKDGQSELSPVSPLSPGPEDQLFSWPGPKTLLLHRTSQGFGFTLRHFIVYPPESAVQASFKDEDNGVGGRQRNRLEPMDTIFVKQVKEGGSAHQAGLCTGDRIVKVNGESIIGKTYSQVISLIQNSDASLQLCVMPKDEDILQLAYSKDAYLKGNEVYKGNAEDIPEPPPICYPGIEPKTSGMTQPEVPPAPSGCQGVVAQEAEPCYEPKVDYCMDIPVQPSCPTPLTLHGCKPPIVPTAQRDNSALSSIPHRSLDENNCILANASYPENPLSVRPRSQTTPSSDSRGSLFFFAPRRPGEIGQLSTQVPVQNTHSTPYSLPPVPMMTDCTLRKLVDSTVEVHNPSPADFTSMAWNHRSPGMLSRSPAVSASTPCSPMHQNIDWRNYTTYKEYIDNKRLYTYGNRTIQERLDCLRAASLDTEVKGSLELNHCTRRAQLGPKSKSYEAGSALLSVSPDGQGDMDRITSTNWNRSASQDAIPLNAKGLHKPRARSCDHLSRRGESKESLTDRRIYGRTETQDGMKVCTEEEPTGCRQSCKAELSHRTVDGYSSLPRLNPRGKGTDRLLSRRADSLGNYPAFRHRLTTQTSLLDDSYVAKALASLNRSSVSIPVTLKDQRFSTETPLSNNNTTSCPEKPECQRTEPRESLGISNGSREERLEGTDANVVVVKRERLSGPSPRRHPSYLQAMTETEGGAKKPTDLRTPRITRNNSQDQKTLGAKQLHDSLDSIPFIDEPSSPSSYLDSSYLPACTITAAPPSPTCSSVILRRQLSHDQDSLRLTVLDSDSGAKTERSRSCDEGLDNFRGERQGTLKLLAGLKGLRKTVHQSSEDSGSRRNSSSDIFCETTRAGPLQFRQYSSDKGKRVGGTLRAWKPMHAELRGHSLFLYKDKKEVQSPTSPSEEESQRISIKACLIDISYSDTKRKNVLRLTTSDCEYLFQAEDREDMLAWIRAIQENSNLDDENTLITSTDLINRKIKEYNNLMSPTSSKTEASPRSSRQSIRQTLLGGRGESKTPSPHSPHKDHERRTIIKDDSSPPKEKWTRGIPGLMRKPFEKKAPPGVTFGVRLDDCPPAPTNRFVPLIVEVCCKLVEERGLEYTGIYRVPGNNAAISSMQDELNRGVGDIDTDEDKWRDLNVISSLLKSFFRKLPEPLFTNEKYGEFIDANRVEDPVERLKELKRLLHELPDHHYETLKFLSAHLRTVAENSEKNKMEPRNLAIVFGPTLVRTSEDNMTHMVKHMPDQYKIVETLIQHYDWCFTDDGDEELETVAQTDSAVETQPVPNIDHLLTNIGRTSTSPGEVSDSPPSDSAKSKGSWGSGMDQYSRELVSSIFAAANRKRKKPREKKVHPSSSDDDLDSVFPEKEPQDQIARPEAGSTTLFDARNSDSEASPKPFKEQRNSSLIKRLLSSSTEFQKSPNLISRALGPSRATTSDPPSQAEEATSDPGTMSSATFGTRTNWKILSHGNPLANDQPPGPVGGSATAEVSSITSDYSTTSSMTFLTGAESSALSVDVQSRGGDEADDERSELISEGRPMETDSEPEFFTKGSMRTPVLSCKNPKNLEGASVLRPESQHSSPHHRLLERHAASRQSLQQKTDSESSLDVPGGSGRAVDVMSRSEPSRLSRVLEAVKKGRSTGSLSSASSSSQNQPEPKRLSISDRLKSRLRMSADDMFGIGGPKNNRRKEKRGQKLHRRHTMGGQRDFKELAVINDWCEQGGTEKAAEMADVDRLRTANPREVSIREWLSRERWFYGSLRRPKRSEAAARAHEDVSHTSSVPSCQSSSDHLNGGESKCKDKTSLGSEAHPYKLAGAQVVRSQFYQCL